MEEQEQKPREYTTFTKEDVQVGDGSFEDYVELEANEPLKAHIVSIKKGPKKLMDGTVREGHMYVWYEIEEGEGEGQRYRGDFNPILSPKSNLQKFLNLVYGEQQNDFDPADLLGRPVRILLSEPWGEKGLQFVKSYLKPTKEQEKVEVKQETEDHVLTDEEVAEIFS